MAVGHKTGGREAGTPNRKTKEVAELLESLGCDPIAGMAGIAGNQQNPPELRGRMYAELAQYLYPKRRAVEATITDSEGGLSLADIIRGNRERREAREANGGQIQPA